MSHSTRPGRVFAENETPDSGADALGPGLGISQDEIDDIALDDARPLEDRIARLRELRERAASAGASQLEEDDSTDVVAEIDAMIDALSREEGYADELGSLAALDGATMIDPADRLDTLAPDDEDARHRIEDGDDDDDIDDALDDDDLDDDDVLQLDGEDDDLDDDLDEEDFEEEDFEDDE